MENVTDVIYLLCAATCLAAMVYRLRDVRAGRHDRALLALIAAFGCKTVSLTFAAPVASAAVERMIGVPNACALGVHVFGGVASSAAILIALGYWSYPPERARARARGWIVVACAMAGGLTALWLAAEDTVTTTPGNYLLDNMQHPLVAVYLLLYITAFAAGLLEILRLCIRYAKVAPRPWLRRGLRVTAIGAAVYLVYCVNRLVGLAAVETHTDLSTTEFLTPLCIGIGVLLMVVGLTLPSWGPHTSTPASWWRSYRHHRVLYPLWRDLYQAVPGIALDPPASPLRDRLRVRDIHYYLYRRVIEINDGRLALRSFMDPAVTAEAICAARKDGLGGTELVAAVEVARLAAAADAMTRRLPIAHGGVSHEVPGAENDNYADEVHWLVEMARQRVRLVGQR
jgi:hypothetical protein